MNTKGYGGRRLKKGATIYTNDNKKPRLRLSISGDVEKFATIKPQAVILRGFTGEKVKGKVTIIPEQKYPFKILKARAKNGKDISVRLEEVKGPKGMQYALTVENQRPQKGRYFDTITLETDSKIRPTLTVRVYGDLRAHVEEKQKKKQ